MEISSVLIKFQRACGGGEDTKKRIWSNWLENTLIEKNHMDAFRSMTKEWRTYICYKAYLKIECDSLLQYFRFFGKNCFVGILSTTVILWPELFVRSTF